VPQPVEESVVDLVSELGWHVHEVLWLGAGCGLRRHVGWMAMCGREAARLMRWRRGRLCQMIRGFLLTVDCASSCRCHKRKGYCTSVAPRALKPCRQNVDVSGSLVRLVLVFADECHLT
jgi:hypothetical protein